jgi:hypothetical protein
MDKQWTVVLNYLAAHAAKSGVALSRATAEKACVLVPIVIRWRINGNPLVPSGLESLNPIQAVPAAVHILRP